MISFTFPVWEMHSSKDPIAIIQYPSRKQKEYKLRVLGGKYFYIRDGRKFEGLFELDPTKAYYSGNTPVYYFDSRNCLPIDWQVADELVKFSKRNKLTRLTQKDKIHSSLLKNIQKQTPDMISAISILKDKVLKRQQEIDETLTEFNKKMIETPPEQQPKEETLGYLLTNYLQQKGLLSAEEKGLIDSQVQRGELTLEGLIAKLREKEIISINEPFTRQEELYLEEYGGYNPTQLTSFVKSLLQLDKGLKTMTSIPLKSWMPAGIIMALLIGGSIAAMVLLSNMDDLGARLGGIIPSPPPPPPEPTPPPIEVTPIEPATPETIPIEPVP